MSWAKVDTFLREHVIPIAQDAIDTHLTVQGATPMRAALSAATRHGAVGLVRSAQRDLAEGGSGIATAVVKVIAAGKARELESTILQGGQGTGRQRRSRP